MNTRFVLAALAGSLVALGAAAQTLYKLVDRQGKVTYAQEAPKDFDGTVTRVDIDPRANTATMPKFVPPTPPKPSAASTPAAPAASAQERLERAQKALAEARDNPGPDDVRRVGNVGGGTRPVPTEAYTKRLAELERQVREAEEAVRRGAR